MIRSLACLFLLVTALNASAQRDSMTIGDTIGVYKYRAGWQTNYGYSYYGASQLGRSQLTTILERSPDSLARRFSRQSRQLNWVSTGLVVSSLGLLIASASRSRSRSSGPLLLAGYGALFGSILPQSISAKRLAVAIGSHNLFLRTRPEDYAPPIVYAPTRQWTLSLADTIAIRRIGLTDRYRYRSVAVYPGGQLTRLTASLNDHDVNEGIRYVRTVNRIGGLVGGIGRGLLTGYVTSLLLTRRFRRNSSLNTELLTTGLVCIGADFVLSRHANRVQKRWVMRYNDQVKQQFQPQ